ncbi:MAG: GxxExxY protein [Chitinophagaceae bacterium]
MTQRSTEQFFRAISEKENLLAKEVVNIAFKLHKALGPGLLESVYSKCFCYELERRQIPFVKQQLVPIHYEGLLIDEGLRLDILVDDLLIVELKAQENFHPVWEAQLLSYLKLTGKRIGYLINFHVPLMKDGFKRFVL